MFKSIVASVLLFSLPLLALDLVSNGNFEQSPASKNKVPQSWQDVKNSWILTDSDGFTDSYSVLCTKNINAQLSQTVKCSGNTDYRISAALKNGGAVPFVRITDDKDKILAILKADENIRDEWMTYSAEFRTPKNTRKIVVVIGADGENGSAHADNISIVSAKSAVVKQNEFKLFTPPQDIVNLAFGKTYKFSDKVNVKRLAGKKAAVNLTDGKFTKGHFWTQKSTVGWRFKEKVQITVDLGKVQPIKGFMFSSAAGTAGVEWAEAVYIYTSNDKKEWYYVGDLWENSLKENGAPAADKYNLYRAASLNMPICGRYVCFQIKTSRYVFVDEIAVYKGDDDLLKKSAGLKTPSPETFLNSLMLAKHFRQDADIILENAKIIPADQQKKLADYFSRLLAHPEKFIRPDDKKFIPLLPLHKAQEEIFAKNNIILAAHGYKQPIFWQNCRWDNLSPIAIPPVNSTPSAVSVDMMAGEVRGEVINILNPTDKVIDYKVSVEGLPVKANLDCREVLFMDTKQGEYVASALKPGNGNSVTVKIHPGTSRQVWFSFAKPDLNAGIYKAKIKAEAANSPTLEIPLQLAISKVRFPKRPRLHVGGWEYLDGAGNYYGGAGNMKSSLAILKDLYVDAPGGNPRILPKGAVFDEDGHLTNPDKLDFTNWNKWVARFPDARIFNIVMRCKDNFQKEPMGTPRFNNMVSEYMDAFAKYLRTTSIKPENIVLNIIDEPRAPSYDRIFIAWARAIQKNNPGFMIKVNPIYHNPEDATPEMIERSNILCPDTIEMIIGGDKYRDFFWNRTKNGKKTLWLYSCSGPARLLDPVYYHRVQKWHCFYMNAKGSFYWAFGCGGGRADSWHAYAQPGIEYSPYYVSPTEVMHAKQSEGIREGVQDHEYLSMLKDRVAELKKAGIKSKDIDEAEKLLAEGPRAVLDHYLVFPDNGKRYFYGKHVVIRWKTPRNRDLMDQIRIKTLRLLEKLQ